MASRDVLLQQRERVRREERIHHDPPPKGKGKKPKTKAELKVVVQARRKIELTHRILRQRSGNNCQVLMWNQMREERKERAKETVIKAEEKEKQETLREDNQQAVQPIVLPER